MIAVWWWINLELTLSNTSGDHYHKLLHLKAETAAKLAHILLMERLETWFNGGHVFPWETGYRYACKAKGSNRMTSNLTGI
ncbi:hypothetical protein OPV22_020066 [Ensete ventricosum]|uniref:Uncharacterized protein n=1 Tax=Ensete ventricosum TaxID=4639 RepID=A0AAV8QIH0_ENSVE|nr:hypothetical protein OPV22_020066 [Ensete ventricosum]